MQIDELRIYSGSLEQGLDFKDYFLRIDKNLSIKNVYPTKARGLISDNDSTLAKISKLKDFDLSITIISQKQEIPILLVEYSTAVPTDDHKMQRSDVYFWVSIFQIPVLKISPLSKNSSTNHGGGDKITLSQELSLTLKQKALVYFIDWKSDKNAQLITHKEKLSCIFYSDEILQILKNIIEKVQKYENFALVYENLLREQMQFFDKNELENLKNSFVNSTRFQRFDNKIIVKINRFGHAMDPDRGILFFISQIFGIECVISKFVVQRERFEGRESYKALFDGLSAPIKTKLNALISQPFNESVALKMFKTATSIDINFTKIAPKCYEIADNELVKFLQNYTSMTYKSIFINSHKVQLCDFKNEILCEISWNPKIIKNYLQSLNLSQNTPLKLSPLTFDNAKEDIITYASAWLLKRVGCEILAISYPDAQGDKAILIGSGRATKRIYLDIIAKFKDKTHKIFVLLQENKEKYADLKDDELKLLNLKDKYVANLSTLLNKLNFKYELKKQDIFLGLGSKYARNSVYFDVDYIIAFDIRQNATNSIIAWSVAIINVDLLDIFKPLVNAQNKLQGEILLDLLYKA